MSATAVLPADTFRALGDPVRCRIVQHLSAHGDTTVNDLTALFPITVQAVSRHIKVLEAAGLVSQRKAGRERPVRLERQQVDAAAGWLGARVQQLEAKYERLDAVLTDLRRSST